MKQLIGVELKRFLRQYKKRNPPSRAVAILLQSVSYTYNVANIFRMADGAGVKQLILSGITPTPPNPTIRKIGRAKDRNVRWRYVEDPLEAMADLKDAGYHLLALELTERAHAYHRYEYPPKVCLIAGHEDHGVTRQVLSACDDAVFVPMYGKGRSHNVATAVAIVTYHALLANPYTGS